MHPWVNPVIRLAVHPFIPPLTCDMHRDTNTHDTTSVACFLPGSVVVAIVCGAMLFFTYTCVTSVLVLAVILPM